MKHFFALVPFVVVCSIIGCKNESQNNEQETIIKEDVVLSFGYFTLGDDFKTSVDVAKNDSDIIITEEDYDGALEYVKYKTSIPNFVCPNKFIPIVVIVSSYLGKIFQIDITSMAYDAREAFPKMYIAKYGGEEKIGSHYYKWEFNNATLTLQEEGQIVEERVLISSRAHLSLNCLDSYYTTIPSFSYDYEHIVYLDNRINDKVVEFKLRMKNQTDSINEIKRAQKEAEEQNEIRKKEASKKAEQRKIVNTLRY